MTPFFRKIRKTLAEENKPIKYFRYAIGEIVLVVIGILIALSINNWNQQKNNKIEESIILINLIEDLKADIVGYNESIDWLKSRQANVDSLLMFLENPKIPINDAKLTYWLITSGYILDYTPVYPTYTEIVGSGKLSLIESDEIKKGLANYKSNFENDVRVFKSYDVGVKRIEFKSLSYTNGKPIAQFYGDDYNLKNKNVNVDRVKLLQDEELIALLKHNSYHTQVEINLKTLEYIPMADSLIKMIEFEIKNFQ
jgi:hypothetical protein